MIFLNASSGVGGVLDFIGGTGPNDMVPVSLDEYNLFAVVLYNVLITDIL
jgi:hypothetical protein